DGTHALVGLYGGKHLPMTTSAFRQTPALGLPMTIETRHRAGYANRMLGVDGQPGPPNDRNRGPMEPLTTIRFSDGQAASAARVYSESLALGLQALGLESAPTLVIIGGASKLTSRDADKLRPLALELWR